MLPAPARVRSRTEHRLIATRGRRSRRGPLVVHVVTDPTSGSPARAGVVVGRKVGAAVPRNLVKRRLRALLAERLPDLPPGALVVVRALPGAASTDFPSLRRHLDIALAAATGPPARPVEPSPLPAGRSPGRGAGG